ncbi:MAG: N-acetylneuraminate synthase family protein [Chitinophagales bacterium]
MRQLKDYGINAKHPTYVIAEIGLNHGGDLNVAKKMIDAALSAGADAVKFQTYLTEKRTFPGSPIFDILKKCELPFAAFKELKDYAQARGGHFFSTPFDAESVDYLESIGCDLYKVASFDVTNMAFLRKVAQTGKPVILSVGMSDVEEIRTAYMILREHTRNIALLHCISAYPTKEEDANLGAIATLMKEFDCLIGQSDHTAGIQVPLYAVAAGARIIEKHFKMDEQGEVVDNPVSITTSQMKKMVDEIRHIEKIFGDGVVHSTAAQKGTEIFRRKSA